MSLAPIFHNITGLSPLITSWKSQGNTIAFTNGCFDILHKGHTDYLTASSTIGNRLIVGLNSDISIQKIKGANRPIQDQNCRSSVLRTIKGIDAVIFFDDETPISLIKGIKPDFIIKGGDYKEEEMIGRDFVKSYGGQCIILPFTKGYSTSAIINKITTLK